jgi:conjugal transfer pilus assembly protein TraL
MQPLELPHGVDDPPSLLLWRLDDLIPLILMLVIGMLTDRLVMFLLLGLVLSRLYGRFRDSRPDGFALHWCYWRRWRFIGRLGGSGLVWRHRGRVGPWRRWRRRWCFR